MGEFLWDLLKAVIIAAMPIVVVYFVQFVRQKIAEITAEINNDKIEMHLQRATDVVLQAVMFVAQTYVDEVRASGQFDKNAHAKAFNMAKDVANRLLDNATKEVVTNVYGDFTLWLDTKIEQYVQESK